MKNNYQRLNVKRTILIFLILVINLCRAYNQVNISVYANQELDPKTEFMQGFLHGGSGTVDSVKVSKLKPKFWRIGAYFLSGSGYGETKRFNPKITVNINDLYMIVNNITSQTLSQPWADNWVKWDNLLSMIASNSINNNEPVDVWAVWGEPDNFWTGTYWQWIELYRRTDSILTAFIPNAKIIGPEFGFGTCNFDVNPILQFLDSLYLVGSGVSGVSWHEFCNPHDVLSHVKQVRDSLTVRPWLGNLDILIPEYAGPKNYTIPGWNVGWLFYLEKSKVDWVSHSCWNETDDNVSWSNCEVGLNGLFLSDNFTPQPNYWVHRAYAELNNSRIQTSSTHEKTVALASKENTTQELKIIVGRYDNPNLGSHNSPVHVEFIVENYPYCSNCTMPLVIQRIPSNNVPFSISLNSPETIFSGFVNFTGNTGRILLNNFVDGDVYLLYINPTTNSVLASTMPITQGKNPFFQFYPNPTSEWISLKFWNTQNENEQIQIFNSMGLLVKEIIASELSPINIYDLPNGLYFIGIKDKHQYMEKLIKN